MFLIIKYTLFTPMFNSCRKYCSKNSNNNGNNNSNNNNIIISNNSSIY